MAIPMLAKQMDPLREQEGECASVWGLEYPLLLANIVKPSLPIARTISLDTQSFPRFCKETVNHGPRG